jgi:alkanesulfonate monooxygenase SsuD/methylene tetrahydromethanopterin reductase-like flavin-dependent oxidoreductase (luciferase family)
MKDLWTNPVSEFHGKWVDYPPIICDPKPVQKPHPPVLIGGELERSAQRIADYGDGWLPRARNTSKYHDPSELPAARRHIEDLYHERGRDPANLTITMWDAPPDREKNRQFFDAGADHIVHMLVTADEASAREQLELVAEAVL